LSLKNNSFNIVEYSQIAWHLGQAILKRIIGNILMIGMVLGSVGYTKIIFLRETW